MRRRRNRSRPFPSNIDILALLTNETSHREWSPEDGSLCRVSSVDSCDILFFFSSNLVVFISSVLETARTKTPSSSEKVICATLENLGDVSRSRPTSISKNLFSPKERRLRLIKYKWTMNGGGQPVSCSRRRQRNARAQL